MGVASAARTAPVSVGLLGAGKHGQRYAHHLQADVPELRLTALSRRDAVAGAAQAQALGCRFHARWEDAVSDPAVDAVVAAVPPTLHPAIVGACIAAGKPLLIEKPLAASGAAAADIARRLRASALPCLMAHTLRWNGVVQTLRRCLPEIGPLQAVSLNQRFEPSTLAWLDDPVIGGGIIGQTGVHSFDLVRALTGGEVVRVRCTGARVVTRRTNDNFAALLELEAGLPLVTVTGSRSTAGRSGLIDLAGTKGQLVGDHALGFAYRVTGTTRTALEVPDPVPTVREALRAFAALLLRSEAPPVTPDDGARAVLISDACRRAAESGDVVAVTRLD